MDTEIIQGEGGIKMYPLILSLVLFNQVLPVNTYFREGLFSPLSPPLGFSTCFEYSRHRIEGVDIFFWPLLWIKYVFTFYVYNIVGDDENVRPVVTVPRPTEAAI